jgi:transketolase
VAEGAQKQQSWEELRDRYQGKFPDDGRLWSQIIAGKLPDGWRDDLPPWKPEDTPIATREASGKILDALAGKIPNLVGGSADLNPSTKQRWPDLEISSLLANTPRPRDRWAPLGIIVVETFISAFASMRWEPP